MRKKISIHTKNTHETVIVDCKHHVSSFIFVLLSFYKMEQCGSKQTKKQIKKTKQNVIIYTRTFRPETEKERQKDLTDNNTKKPFRWWPFSEHRCSSMCNERAKIVVRYPFTNLKRSNDSSGCWNYCCCCVPRLLDDYYYYYGSCVSNYFRLLRLYPAIHTKHIEISLRESMVNKLDTEQRSRGKRRYSNTRKFQEPNISTFRPSECFLLTMIFCRSHSSTRIGGW